MAIPQRRWLSSRMLPLIAAAFFVLATIQLWSEIYYSLIGVRTSGEVIEFHTSRARSISIVAEVEVDMPGVTPFRWEVDDPFGTQSWEPGGRVPLLCARIHADHMSCVVDSWLDRFLFPLIAIPIGVGVLLWLVKRRRAGTR
ncbi:MAG TPA: hypothetical protein VIY51_02790 [Xanthobacteraceae bacterium]